LIQELLKFLVCVSIGLIVTVPVSGDSLWKQRHQSIYGEGRRISVGDVITIFISESTSAIQEAGTRTSSRSNIGAEFDDIWDQLALNKGQDQQLRKYQRYGIRGENRFDGIGSTSRKSSVKAVISAVVTDIEENGNLQIVGAHKIKVNEETETIHISGLVRPQYVTDKNTVFSYQIANLEVSLRGAGVVAEKQKPSAVSKFFGWLF